MIGLIVAGHGQFALGLTSSLKMIAGDTLEQYYAIEFVDGAPFEKLSDDIKTAVDELIAKGSQVLICTDLLGGSPFKAAMLLQTQRPDDIAVLVGTNLGMLIEGNLMRQFSDDVKALAQQLEETGRSQVQYVAGIEVRQQVADEDGI